LIGALASLAATFDRHTALEEWVFRGVNADGGWLLDRLGVVLSARAFGIAFGIVLALLVESWGAVGASA
jgi:hypothetical protein